VLQNFKKDRPFDENERQKSRRKKSLNDNNAIESQKQFAIQYFNNRNRDQRLLWLKN
jgi:hypothetical protein